jgi:hypothetical protein
MGKLLAHKYREFKRFGLWSGSRETAMMPAEKSQYKAALEALEQGFESARQ